MVPGNGEHVLSIGGDLRRQVLATGARFGTGVARQSRARVIAIGSATVALIAGAGTYLLTQGGGSIPPNAPISPGVTLPGPFRVISMTPAPGAQHADGSDPVQVTFSAPVSAGSPRPAMSPSVPGSWQATGDTLMFTPAVPFSPSTRVTVTIPAGVRSARGSLLAKPMTTQFTTEPLGMQIASKSAATGRAGELQLAYDPPPGSMNWDQGYPASLASLWKPCRAPTRTAATTPIPPSTCPTAVRRGWPSHPAQLCLPAGRRRWHDRLSPPDRCRRLRRGTAPCLRLLSRGDFCHECLSGPCKRAPRIGMSWYTSGQVAVGPWATGQQG